MSTHQLNTRIKLKHDITANWNVSTSFVPLKGEIIIYDDYFTKTVEVNGETVTRYIPNIKIGDGLAYVTDLPFVDEYIREQLIAHIENSDIHVTPEETTMWNNKVNIDDTEEVISGELQDETLIFTRF